MTKELQLIEKVLELQFEQRQYRSMKRVYGNATQQLNKCVALEKSLAKYCLERKNEIEYEQKQIGRQLQLLS